MRGNITTLLLVGLVTVLLAPIANAMQQAARTGVSTISPCPSFCGGPGIVSEFDNDGGVGFSSAFSSLDNADGNGRAQAELTGSGIGLPTLRADAFSNTNSRVSSSATAMQHYVYSGATSDFTLDLTLDGTVINGSQPPDAVLRANVVVVLASEIEFFSDYGTFRFESIPSTPGATLLDEMEINFLSLGLFDMGPQSAMDSITFTLNDGDEVFIWANLTAQGTRGGSADSFSTASLNFSDGNLAGIAVVPLPAPALMLLSGLLVLQARRRLN